MTIVSATDNTNTTSTDTNTIASTDDVTTDNSNIADVKEEKYDDEYVNTNTAASTKSVTKQDTTSKDTKEAGIIIDVGTPVYGYQELSNIIDEVNDGWAMEVTLRPGDYNATKSFEIGTDPNKVGSLWIYGHGMVLDGNGLYNFITVSNDCSLILQDITFTNFVGGNGSVIKNNGGTITLKNCNFINNHANDRGGVVYNGLGDVSVNGSTFMQNTVAVDGGAIFNLKGNLTVSNSSFTNNSAVMGGGAIYNKGNLSINNGYCNFINNIAGNTAGAVCNHAGNISINGAGFIGNNASQSGGAIYNLNSVILSDFENCYFENNHANVRGGVFYNNKSNVSVFTSNFIGNTATVDGAAIYNFNGTLTVTNSNFTSNTAGYSGGAIYDQNGTVIVRNSSFIKNTGTIHSGGAIAFSSPGNFLQIFNSVFMDNYALLNGGAIYETGHLDIFDSQFTNNTGDNGSAVYGGGSNYYNIYLRNVEFLENHAKNNGTICTINDPLCSIYNVSFIRNTANKTGGAISSQFGSLYINGSEFIENTADEFGGAIYSLMDGIRTLNNTKFFGNIVYRGSGGAVYGSFGSNSINNCWFENNSAITAGAIATQYTYDTLKITNSIFNSNDAMVNSVLYSVTNVDIDNCNFSNNIAYDTGGAITTNKLVGKSVINNCNFINNTSQGLGAAVYVTSDYNITSCNFLGNTAKKGAAIYNDINGSYMVDYCSFADNTATYGGAIYDANSKDEYSSYIYNSNFVNNNATLFGGAAYLEKGTYIDRSNFVSNNAFKRYGGAVYLAAGEGVIFGSSFINNTATTQGGAIYSTGSVSNNIVNLRGNTPENFVIEDHKIRLVQSDNYIDAGSVSIYALDENTIDDIYVSDKTPIYTGSLNGFVAPNGRYMKVSTSNGYFALEPTNGTYEVYNYDELVRAVEAAKLSTGDVVINLHPGNYNATAEMIWGPADNMDENNATTKLTINGNGLVLDGKNTYKFITVSSGYTLELNNIAVTHYYSELSGIISNNGNVIVRDSYFADNSLANFENTLSRIFLKRNDGYIPRDATVRISVGDISDDQTMGQGIINNYAIPFGSYNLSIIVNPNTPGNVINTTYVVNIDNDLPLIVNNTSFSYSYDSPVYIYIHTDFMISNANLTFSVNDRVLGNKVINYTTNIIGAALDISDLMPGVYDLNTVYRDTITGYTTSTTSRLTIEKSPVIIELNSLTNVSYCADVVIKGRLRDAYQKYLSNQNLELIIEGKQINLVTDSNGLFNYTTAFKSVGQKNITVVYAGTDKYNSSNKTFNFTVNKADTIITLDDIPTMEYSDKTPITGRFTRSTGVAIKNASIILMINGIRYDTKTDANGYYELNYTATKVGTNNVTATFAGNSVYNAVNTTKTFTVNKKNTTITLNTIPNVEYSDKITISGKFTRSTGVALSNAPIVLMINDVSYSVRTDANGNYSLNYTATKVGTNKVTATFEGNSAYNSVNTTKSFTVSKKNTKITLNTIPNVEYSDKITIGGKFTRSTGVALSNAEIILTINGVNYTTKTNASGNFALNYTVTKVGTNNVTAIFAGNSAYNNANASKTFTVTKKNTTITINTVPDASYADKITITGKLTRSTGVALANAEITVIINGVNYTAITDSSGNYAINYTVTKVGTNNITAIFAGNSAYNKVNTTKTFTVTKKDTKLTMNNIPSTKLSNKVTIKGKFTRITGEALSNASITLTINGVNYTTKTDSSGNYALNYTTNKVGTNNVTATFNGNSVYNNATISKTFTVTS